MFGGNLGISKPLDCTVNDNELLWQEENCFSGGYGSNKKVGNRKSCMVIKYKPGRLMHQYEPYQKFGGSVL